MSESTVDKLNIATGLSGWREEVKRDGPAAVLKYERDKQVNATEAVIAMNDLLPEGLDPSCRISHLGGRIIVPFQIADDDGFLKRLKGADDIKLNLEQASNPHEQAPAPGSDEKSAQTTGTGGSMSAEDRIGPRTPDHPLVEGKKGSRSRSSRNS
jgi:hypothetical protein